MRDDENGHGFKLPLPLWQRYADVVGNGGRSADLKAYIDWRVEHPGVVLGPDASTGCDTFKKIRVDEQLWAEYARCVSLGDRSADIRAYINFRVANPTLPLPGRRRVTPRRDRAATNI